MSEIRTLVVAVVDPEEDLRRAICQLLALELGGRIRAAATTETLMAGFAPNEELALLIGRQSRVGEAGEEALFGLIAIRSVPVDASILLQEVRTRLTGQSDNL